MEEVNILMSHLTNEIPDNLATDSYSLYSEELAQILYKANNIKKLDTNELQKAISKAAKHLSEFKIKMEKQQEQAYKEQIKRTLQVFKSEIDKIEFDDKFNIIVSTFYENLARLKIEALNFKYEDNNSIITLIAQCYEVIDKKRNTFLTNTNNQEEESIKSYNQDALKRINEVKSESDNIGFFASFWDSDKVEHKKIDCLKQLEEIQTNYLYYPILALYQEIYQGLLSGLSNEAKVKFAKEALKVKRRNLNENY